jgi:ribosome biogenesis GTPase
VAKDRSVVLLGESGAGKYTLVNALIGTEVASTGRVREGDAKGRHTTTTRQLHPLPGGGVLLDSPGIRAVGLWVDPDSVDAVFPDIEALAPDCRFGDCAHQGEPGCAVRAAIEQGELAEARLDTWRSMREEAEAASRTEAERRKRDKTGTKAYNAHQRRNRRG